MQETDLNALIQAPDQVLAYSTVTLDGSYSSDTTASISSYQWTQTAGQAVTLAGPTTSKASFAAPSVTAAAPLSFSLLVTDTAGATSTASATVTVNRATASQLHVAIVSVSLFEPVSGGAHSQFASVDGPPLSGSLRMLRVAMSGPVQEPAFALVDATGNSLATAGLPLLGASSDRPIVFFGSIVVPTVPFRVRASGTAGDGQAYTAESAELLAPMNLSMSFVPSRLLLAPGAAGTSELTIFNGGAESTFEIAYSDPHGLLTSAPPSSVRIAASSSATMPIPVVMPQDMTNLVLPSLTATATVSGDATRQGTAALTLWEQAP